MRKVILFVIILSMSASVYAGVEMTKQGVKFFYEAPNAGQVSVAGEFNDWNTSAHIMKMNNDGVWEIVIPLDSGAYMYKFVVDGNWVADPDNPKQQDDGYGGVNSLVEVGSSGDLIVEKVIEQKQQTGVRTFLNPKVLFDGRVYSKNIFEKEEYNDKLMLDKPLYDMNLDMKIKFNSQVEGYTVMNINNIAEGVDMWKTHLNFKRSYLKLDAPYFLVQAFDKYGFLTFDDPLHLVGALGFRDYDFGYDVMGVYGKSNVPTVMLPLAKIPFTFNFEAVFGDNVGDNDMDVKAGRASGDFHVIPETASITLGYGEYHAQLPVNSTSSQEHVSSEVDLQLNYSFDQPGWTAPLNVSLMGEYYKFKDTDNTNMDSLKTEFANGDRMFAGLNIDFPAAIGMFAHYQRNKISLQKDVTKNILTIGSTFETKTLTAKLSMSTWKTEFPDSLLSWRDYYVYMERTDGNGRWFQTCSEVPFAKYTLVGYETALFWDIAAKYAFDFFGLDFAVGYEGKIAQQDLKYEPKFVENILTWNWDISPKWSLYTDCRIPLYNDPFLGLKTDYGTWEDVFWSNFTSLTYHLSRNVKLSLYWGVNPIALSTISDEFMPIGRFEYLNDIGNFENYLENSYTAMGERIRMAEKSLTQEQRIGLEAVITF